MPLPRPGALAFALAVALSVGGCAPATPAATLDAGASPAAASPSGMLAGAPSRPTGPTQEAALVRVVDGDTIRVVVDGVEERVRYIGIDTPELNTSSAATPEPWAAAATAENVDLLATGGRLVLERDVSEHDRYGRLLRHPWVEAGGRWTLLSLALVAGGFAQVTTYPPDVKYVDALLAAQRDARGAGRGLWGTAP